MKTIETSWSIKEACISEHPDFYKPRAEWGVIEGHWARACDEDGWEFDWKEWIPEDRSGHRPELDGMSLADMWDFERKQWRIEPPGFAGITSFLRPKMEVTEK